MDQVHGNTEIPGPVYMWSESRRNQGQGQGMPLIGHLTGEKEGNTHKTPQQSSVGCGQAHAHTHILCTTESTVREWFSWLGDR